MKSEQLIELGLTKNQAKTYVELVTTPKQTVGELARRLSIDRSFMYGILKSLNNKGLAGYVMTEGRRVYYASSPENLLEEIEEKRTIAFSVIKDLKVIEQLTEQVKSVNIYDGKAGLKLLSREILKERHFKLMGGGGVLLTLDNLRYDYPHYIHELCQKNIKGKIIVSKNNIARLNKLLKGSKIKLKPLQKKPSQVNFAIFSDKIAIFSSDKARTIIIKDKQVSEALEIYFDIIWDQVN